MNIFTLFRKKGTPPAGGPTGPPASPNGSAFGGRGPPAPPPAGEFGGPATGEVGLQETQASESGSPAASFAQGLTSIKDIVAPSAMEVDFNHLQIGSTFFRTLFVSGYPRFVGANWLAPLINFEHSLNISMFYYPVSAAGVLEDLKRKIGEMEATLRTEEQRSKVLDPAVKAALEDAKTLQEQLVKGVERFFQFSFYITVPATSVQELDKITQQVESVLGSLMVVSKSATLQMDEAFQSTLPLCLDQLGVVRNMDTTSLATTFPFTSSELTMNEGVLYGLNEHNGSLIIFDRFSMENANSVVFAKSGSGKSYMVKLEILRSLMFGTEVIVVDPEQEYKRLAEAVGGQHVAFSVKDPVKINPFDLSGVYEEGENELGLKILSLHTLFKVILGQLSATEDAILDRALIATYKLKGITQDPATQKKEPPIMEDLYKVLLGMEEEQARSLAERLERYVKGSLAGIFDQQSTFDITNQLTVFSTQNLEDQLRPVAIYIILDYIWTRVKREMKKRLLIVDEAWYLMQHPDSAMFLYSIAKRSRKYYLGLTTITQDVGDFLATDQGKAIVTNSSIQVLLKQHPAAIDQVAQVFYLSQGERRLLLSAGLGEGLFFAGTNHVAIRVVASPEEHKLASTKPKELLEMKEQEEAAAAGSKSPAPAQQSPESSPPPATGPTTAATLPTSPTPLPPSEAPTNGAQGGQPTSPKPVPPASPS